MAVRQTLPIREVLRGRRIRPLDQGLDALGRPLTFS